MLTPVLHHEAILTIVSNIEASDSKLKVSNGRGLLVCTRPFKLNNQHYHHQKTWQHSAMGCAEEKTDTGELCLDQHRTLQISQFFNLQCANANFLHEDLLCILNISPKGQLLWQIGACNEEHDNGMCLAVSFAYGAYSTIDPSPSFSRIRL